MGEDLDVLPLELALKGSKDGRACKRLIRCAWALDVIGVSIACVLSDIDGCDR